MDVDINQSYPNDHWNQLQLAVSLEDFDTAKRLLACNADANYCTKSVVIPQVTSLHIAAKTGNLDLIELLLTRANINAVDQWGFTPLHYAAVAQQGDAVSYLLNHGASILTSRSGSTPLELAQECGFQDIVDTLMSRINLENDPLLPQFKDWLMLLSAIEYLPKFLSAGYDLQFIHKHGLSDADLDCIGVPLGKLGLRRKLKELNKLDEVYSPEVEDGEDDDDDDEVEEDDDEEDDGSEDEDE